MPVGKASLILGHKPWKLSERTQSNSQNREVGISAVAQNIHRQRAFSLCHGQLVIRFGEHIESNPLITRLGQVSLDLIKHHHSVSQRG
ncbi:MAG: hypothetical protein EBU28_12370 [Gammaproteobacteria bacterium]|nr:hypothetical protein [Gammaproteobacteria bacterium]